MKYLISICLFILIMASCATTNSVVKDSDDEMVLKENEISKGNNLESYLSRTPGVRISGGKVQIRGVNSFSGGTEPLFIVNGSDVGNSYANAAGLVRNMEIESIKVLKGSDATLYGVRGAGGVILIKAK